MEDDRIALLIVDDDTEFLEATSMLLEARGLRVTAASSGAEAIRVAREQPLDVALVDLSMPGLDGEATLAALKREHEWMEVVILTGLGSIESAVNCAKGGAYSYLEKPCALDRLLEVLQEAYSKRVMNRKQLDAERLEEILRLAQSGSPLSVLRRLKELDREGT
jgi:DNA-binding NtrC family response regulator